MQIEGDGKSLSFMISGEEYSDGCACADFAVEFYSSLMLLDGFIGDSQPEPDALHFRREEWRQDF